MTNNIFITYNPNEDIEFNTALRMQTIAHLYGLNVDLPARMQSKEMSSETQQRIQRADVVLAISLHKMSKILQSELHQAMKDQKSIVVLYDQKKGKTIDFKDYPKVQEIQLDFNQTDQALHQVAAFLKEKAKLQPKNQAQQDNNGLVLGLLTVGLGLLALWALSNKDYPKAKNTKANPSGLALHP